MKNKKIMFIIPTLCGGGAEKTVANLSKYLIDLYDIDIVVFKDTPIKYSYSGNLIVLNDKKNSNFIKKVLFFFKAIKKVKHLKKDNKIDYAISFLTPADSINVFSKVKGCKTLISIRNTDSILMNSFIMKNITKLSCKRCDKIVSISNQVKDDIINNFKIASEKIVTIYNPSLRINFGKSKIKLDDDFFSNFVFINTGRLVDQKGQWHLIRSFSYVVKRHPNVKLIILGQGPNEEYLKSLIINYHLEDNIKMLGFVDNPYDYISKSDCFVFSSLYEGLGNVLLESLACGTPIISTDCISGPREILAPNTDYRIKVANKIEIAEFGVLVPVFDGIKRNSEEKLTNSEILLSEAMCKLIENPELLKAYKEKSYLRSRDFSIDNIVEQWNNLLKEI